MVDVFTPAQRSAVMSRIRSSGNKETELELIRLFRIFRITGWRRGQALLFHSNNRTVRVRPDFLFRAKRVVVFVDGEFWHGHPTRSRMPQTRRSWWAAKIEGNRRRDRLQNRALRALGWTVVRVWQFELQSSRALRKLKQANLC